MLGVKGIGGDLNVPLIFHYFLWNRVKNFPGISGKVRCVQIQTAEGTP